MCKKSSFSFVFFLFILFFSCKQENNIPNEVIPEEKMVEVITQLEITQAYLKIKSAALDSNILNLNQHQTEILNTVLTQHSITQEEFNTSINYYATHPKRMEKIYSKAIEKLSEKQAEFHAVNH